MTAIDLFSLYALFSQYWSLANTLEFRTFCGEGRNTSSPKNACMGSLPADVLWGSFVTQRNECVTNERLRGGYCVGCYKRTQTNVFGEATAWDAIYWPVLLVLILPVVRNSLCLHDVPMKEGSLKWVFFILWGVELRSLAPLECEEVPL